ncbi:hypothetical protein CCR94_10495 [Rhodoblastus sphagnicola]|uniref:Uncharacterized protein n=1 Tax=Rhodoblastus sphagnicola TaxID=333368 RepID=A0A2S6N8T5_9HYPH|nr:hypothetical protein [Rhodoblastus sphagnicola]MBB4200970.1 hypothetical protein [Rhodoblastus sphagnicola]PPQ31020.1 hypothetical protein CCR94_10495 [Rhodoblastus sphagnicola]
MKASIKARLAAMSVKSSKPYRVILCTEGDAASVEGEVRLAGELEGPGVKIVVLTVPRRSLERTTIQ